MRLHAYIHMHIHSVCASSVLLLMSTSECAHWLHVQIYIHDIFAFVYCMCMVSVWYVYDMCICLHVFTCINSFL